MILRAFIVVFSRRLKRQACSIALGTNVFPVNTPSYSSARHTFPLFFQLIQLLGFLLACTRLHATLLQIIQSLLQIILKHGSRKIAHHRVARCHHQQHSNALQKNLSLHGLMENLCKVNAFQ